MTESTNTKSTNAKNTNTSGTIKVEVAYARPDKQLILTVQVSEGTTAVEAAQQSGIAEKFPEIDLSTAKLGVFGKSIKSDAALRENDRVEIYRALIADPKQARRDRAAAAK